MRSAPRLRLLGVGLVRDERVLLDGIDLEVLEGEHWVVLGPNGSGKSSLLSIAALALAPSSGEVEVLGRRRGEIDLRELRPRIGWAAAGLVDRLRPSLTAREVVMTARHAALEPWWHRYDHEDRAAAVASLERLDVAHLADRSFGTLSSGERQRVLVARTLVVPTGLLLLDEPAAGLDLGAREQLVGGLARLASDPSTPPIVFVTHHVEEIPLSFTHVLLLRGGRVLAAGDLADTLTEAALSAAFSMPLSLSRRRGRWSAVARHA